MITFTEKGNFNNTERWLARMSTIELYAVLNKYGAEGVAALSAATPFESGLASGSWSYSIQSRPGYYSIRWHNDDETVDGTPVVILLQYGHGTGTGGYVEGRDFINPAIQPIFDAILAEAESEVRRV